jgi:hypothetical protein
VTTQRDSDTCWLAIPLSLLMLLAICCTVDGSAEGLGGAVQANAAGASGVNTPVAETARVLQTMNAGGYSYARLDIKGQSTWFAGSPTRLVVGDTVAKPPRTMAMHGFHSNTLGRTFDVIYFVEEPEKVAHGRTRPATRSEVRHVVERAHAVAAKAGPGVEGIPSVDLAGIAEAEGGMTVAEVFARGEEAAGYDVVLRGRVVKYNAGILGRNWLHVRDGRGAEGGDDLVVTTTDTAAIGDTVLVRGKLAADRDLGSGYRFELMIEDAAITVE